MKKLQILVALALASMVTTSFAAGKSTAAQSAKPGPASIVEIVLIEDGEFDVLQAAVIKAGLVDALNGKKQLTVFAPTDAAFVKTLGVADEAAALATIDSLPVEALQKILLYHVIEGRRISTSVLAAPKYKTLNGKFLPRTELAAAGIAETDISASNGVIHIIDSVLLP
jgi:uncharacterized surface protein with fasciclin (FAS1) repeats